MRSLRDGNVDGVLQGANVVAPSALLNMPWHCVTKNTSVVTGTLAATADRKRFTKGAVIAGGTVAGLYAA